MGLSSVIGRPMGCPIFPDTVLRLRQLRDDAAHFPDDSGRGSRLNMKNRA